MSIRAESIIEAAAFGWLKNLGYEYTFDPEITFDNSPRTLAILRDPLLPGLIWGEVGVKDVER